MTFAGMAGKVRPYGCGLGGGGGGTRAGGSCAGIAYRIRSNVRVQTGACNVGQILAWEGAFSLLAFSQCAGFAVLKCAGMYYRNYRKKEEVRW